MVSKVLMILSLVMVSTVSMAQVHIQSYDEALAEARQNCGMPIVIEAIEGQPSVVNGGSGVHILGGYEGQHRGQSECHAASSFKANQGEYVCIISDAVGLIMSAASNSNAVKAGGSALLACVQTDYYTACNQGSVTCFLK